MINISMCNHGGRGYSGDRLAEKNSFFLFLLESYVGILGGGRGHGYMTHVAETHA